MTLARYVVVVLKTILHVIIFYSILQRKTVERYVQLAREEGADVYQACACIPNKGCFYPPTLITNVDVRKNILSIVGFSFIAHIRVHRLWFKKRFLAPSSQ